jgi:hypothetical protein
MARGYRRFSPADEDEIWGSVASWSCGKANCSGLGADGRWGAGVPGAVWWDPARSASALSGPVESG